MSLLSLVEGRLERFSPAKFTNKRREAFYGILFVSPAIIGFLAFVLWPMLASLLLSFTNYNVLSPLKFVGLSNYVNMFNGTDPLFLPSLWSTLYYVLLSVPTTVIFAFFVALLLNQRVKALGVFRSVFYLPSIVPLVASSFIWLWLFNPQSGLFNALLGYVGLPGSQWLFGEKTVIPSLAFMHLWTAGGMMVIFLAGLQGIPRYLYESIEIDGGKFYHKLVYVTVPMMTPTIFFNLVMALITAFQTFAEPYIMTSGGPDNKSLFLNLYLYQLAFQQSKMGYASAVSWIIFILVAVCTALMFKFAKSWVYYEYKG